MRFHERMAQIAGGYLTAAAVPQESDPVATRRDDVSLVDQGHAVKPAKRRGRPRKTATIPGEELSPETKDTDPEQ